MRNLLPSAVWSNKLQGTTNTSRPSLTAISAVINEPLLPFASTTITPLLRPLIIRFRAGKCLADGGVPGGYSDTSKPLFCKIRSNNFVFSRGYTISNPQPMTTIPYPRLANSPS